MFRKLFKTNNTTTSGVVAVLDVGSYSTICIIAKINYIDKKKPIKIIGSHRVMTKGFEQGIVTNMSKLFSCVASAIYEAEQKAAITLKEIYMCAPSQSCVFNSLKVNLKTSGKEIKKNHVDSLIQLAQKKIQNNQNTLLHISTTNFILDDVKGIENPIGLMGNVLSAKVGIISAENKFINNLLHCIKKCHIEVKGLIAGNLSTSLACMHIDEKKIGTIVIDIGASCTSICVCRKGSFEFVDSFNIGGDNITLDIAQCLNTTIEYAERIKNLYGSLIGMPHDERESIFIPVIGEKINSINDVNNHKISKAKLVQIICARFEDIVKKINEKIKKFLPNYRIIIVGGVAKTSGLKEFMHIKLNAHVRIGSIENVVNINKELPELANAVGMLNYLKDNVEYSPRKKFLLSGW